MRERRSGFFPGTSPKTPIVPDVGSSKPVARCRRVVLPAPFGPTSALTRPWGSVNEQS
jgi:hypothetical protein